MDNQPTAVLQNIMNVYSDKSMIHEVFQRHRRPSDDGATGPFNKKLRIEVITEGQEAEPQTFVEDVVEDVPVPKTNTFRMLRNMFRARNALAQPSSAYPVLVE